MFYEIVELNFGRTYINLHNRSICTRGVDNLSDYVFIRGEGVQLIRKEEIEKLKVDHVDSNMYPKGYFRVLRVELKK